MNDFNDLVYKYFEADFFSTSEYNKTINNIIAFLMEDFQVNKETAIRIWTRHIDGVTEDDIISKYESVKELINMIKENN